MSLTAEETFVRIQQVLRAVCELNGADTVPITLDTHLILELGLTSIKFIDLTLALEESLGIDEYPLQDWIDIEQERGADGFRVRSMLETCLAQRTSRK